MDIMILNEKVEPVIINQSESKNESKRKQKERLGKYFSLQKQKKE